MIQRIVRYMSEHKKRQPLADADASCDIELQSPRTTHPAEHRC